MIGGIRFGNPTTAKLQCPRGLYDTAPMQLLRRAYIR